MSADLCGNNDQKWKEAEEATITALQHCILSWNGVYEEIKMPQNG